MPEPKPSVGRIVHYVSHGTPVREDGTQAYTSQCRAAIITDLTYADPGLRDVTYEVDLCILNPTGMVFAEDVLMDAGTTGPDHNGDTVTDIWYQGGTWHWPERV